MKIHDLLTAMGKHNASDLHLKVNQPPIFRVNGELIRLKSAPLSDADLEGLLMPLVVGRNLKDWDVRGYADFSVSVPEVGRFRCNVYKQLSSISAAIRRVRPKIPTYADLGLPPQIPRLAQLEQGLVLVGGITGSGKSTTIASILDDINHTRRVHILTIEDPIEYVYTDDKAIVNQREVGLDVASFDDALRSAVREDPDVMLLGEMRDAETVETALTAAETGHLVFGTIHSSNSASTIGRILDLFPPAKHEAIRTAMAFNLKCVLNQKLVKAAPPNPGMVPVVEVMFITPIIRKFILDKEDTKIAEALSRDGESGCEDFTRVLHRLWKEKRITQETALTTAPNPEALRMLMRGITISDGGIV
jgi:twitching motility protein PilT